MERLFIFCKNTYFLAKKKGDLILLILMLEVKKRVQKNEETYQIFSYRGCNIVHNANELDYCSANVDW